MISKECRNTRQHIDELEVGERPNDGAAAHLATCAACREFRAERTDLRELVGGLEPVVAPADFDMRLRARIAAERSSAPQQPFFARLLTTPALAAAALFVLVTGTVVWVAQRSGDQSVSIATKEQPNVKTTGTNESTAATTSVDSEAAASDRDSDQVVANVPSAAGRRNRAAARGPRSQDYDVLPANSIRQSDQAFVNAPSKPVVFALEDERGTTRKISLPPVTFGAQSLVDNRPVNYSANRIW